MMAYIVMKNWSDYEIQTHEPIQVFLQERPANDFEDRMNRLKPEGQQYSYEVVETPLGCHCSWHGDKS